MERKWANVQKNHEIKLLESKFERSKELENDTEIRRHESLHETL